MMFFHKVNWLLSSALLSKVAILFVVFERFGDAQMKREVNMDSSFIWQKDDFFLTNICAIIMFEFDFSHYALVDWRGLF